MKISKLITEQSFSKYEDFLDALLQAKEQNNYREFERILTDSLKKKQWEWFGRFYQSQDGTSKALTKVIFKEVAPF